MAETITPKKINEKYMKIVQDEIRKVILDGTSTDQTETIDGKAIPIDEEAKYRDLMILEDILKIENNEIKEPKVVFKDFYIPAKDLQSLLTVVRNGNTGIEFPQYLQSIGIIPDYCFNNKPIENLMSPLPIKFLETPEHYEERLAKYYDTYGIRVNVDENGIREAYPHEKCGWENGYAVDNGEEYRSPYYIKYKANAMRNLDFGEEPEEDKQEETINPLNEQNNSVENNNTEINVENDENIEDEIEEETEERQPLDIEYNDENYQPSADKKHRIKDKKDLSSVKVTFKKIANMFKTTDQFLGKDETWSSIKKFVTSLAVGIGGICIGGIALKALYIDKIALIAAGAMAPSAIALSLIEMAAFAGVSVYVIKKRIEKHKKALEKQKEAEQKELEQEETDEKELEQEETKDKENKEEKTLQPELEQTTQNTVNNPSSEVVEQYLGGIIGEMNVRRRGFKTEKQIYEADASLSDSEKKTKISEVTKKDEKAKEIQFQALTAAILNKDLDLSNINTNTNTTGGMKL